MGKIEKERQFNLQFTEMRNDFNTEENKQISNEKSLGERESSAIFGMAELTKWSSSEAQEFLSVVKNENHYLTFLLAIYTGMRQKELVELLWEDLDLVSGVINVKNSLKQKKTRKQNSLHQITIPEFVVNELLVHKKKQNEWKSLIKELYLEQDLVICTKRGSRFPPGIVNIEMKGIIRKSKIMEIKFRNL